MRLTAGQQFRAQRGNVRSGRPAYDAPRMPQADANGVRAVSARVKHTNTPESDRQAEVLHVVTMSDDTTREVMATDPLAALNKV